LRDDREVLLDEIVGRSIIDAIGFQLCFYPAIHSHPTHARDIAWARAER
jgi:hypothetical protein